MKEHEFTLVLSEEPDEAAADRLYGAIDDGTIATNQGVPRIHFHRQADSLEAAIRSAIGDVQSSGLKVVRVEMQPEEVARAT